MIIPDSVISQGGIQYNGRMSPVVACNSRERTISFGVKYQRRVISMRNALSQNDAAAKVSKMNVVRCTWAEILR